MQGWVIHRSEKAVGREPSWCRLNLGGGSPRLTRYFHTELLVWQLMLMCCNEPQPSSLVRRFIDKIKRAIIFTEFKSNQFVMRQIGPKFWHSLLDYQRALLIKLRLTRLLSVLFSSWCLNRYKNARLNHRGWTLFGDGPAPPVCFWGIWFQSPAHLLYSKSVRLFTTWINWITFISPPNPCIYPSYRFTEMITAQCFF